MKTSDIKAYKPTMEFVNENKLEKSKIRNSDIFLFLTNVLGYKEKENLWISNVQSMAMSKEPTLLRIRSDNFLKNVIEGNKCICLISGIRVLGEDLYLVFFGKSFIGYNHKIDCSNSFITFYRDELDKFTNAENSFQTKNISKKGSKYIFYTSTKFESTKLVEFIKMIDDIQLNGYKETNVKYDPNIPSKNRDEVEDIYEHQCQIYYNNPQECKGACDWKDIRIKGLKKPYDLHHVVTKEWFKDQNGIIDWNIVHDPINLVPLCRFCHGLIHSSDKSLSEKTYKAIIDGFKKSNRYDDFILYLKDNTSFNNDKDLLNLYLGKN